MDYLHGYARILRRAQYNELILVEGLGMVTVDQELDCTGLRCPLPLLKAKQALAGLNSGQVLRVIATDPGSVRDFKSWAELSGHQLLSSEELSDQFVHTLRKA